MEKRIRRLGIFMVLCFVALFVQLNNIQVLKANSLANNPNNPRIVAVGTQPDPGQHPLVRRDGAGLVGAGPAGQRLQVPAGLQPEHRHPLRPDHRLRLLIYGNFRGVEAEYNSYLDSPHPAGQDLRDLLANRTAVDNVTLTMNSNLQLQVAAALDQVTAQAVNGARGGGHQPDHRCHRGHVLEPHLRPQPAGVPEHQDRERAPGTPT